MDIDEELAFHLARRTEELIASGLSEDDARRTALAEFGDVDFTRRYCAAQDEARARRDRGRRVFRTARDDAALAVRSLTRRPGAVLAPAAVLSLGIALNVLVFTVVRGVLLSPLPFAEALSLHVLEEAQPGGGLVRAAHPIVARWRADARTVSDVVAYLETSVPLSTASEPIQVAGAAVTEGFLDALDRPFLLGRGFTASEHAVGAAPAVVLSEGLWHDAFASDPVIVGRSVRISGAAHEVVGVVRARAVFPGDARLWLPLEATHPDLLEISGAEILVALGRLRPGVTVLDAATELGALSAAVPGGAPAATLTPIEARVRGDVTTPLLLLQGAVLLVLLAACANAGGMLLTRGVRRSSELAVRLSLGASPGRLAASVLLEGVLIGAAAGAVGVLLAAILLGPVLRAVPADLPAASTIALDPSVLALGFLLAAATGLLSALGPALAGLRVLPARRLREAGPGADGAPGLRRFLEGLVVGQVALATLLTLGAGLLVRSFLAVSAEDPGFDPARVTVVDITLPEARYPDAAGRTAFARELLERARSLPGAEHVALGRNLPISASNMTSPLMVEGHGSPTEAAQIVTVSSDYFRVMGIPLVDGRAFGDEDPAAGPLTLMVDATLRAPDGAPLSPGARAHSFFGSEGMRQIVGVAGPVRHGGLDAAPMAIAYEPFFQKTGPSGFSLLVRSDAPAAAVALAARALLRALDPELPTDRVSTMSARIRGSLAEPRFYATGLAVFGALAVLLALAGCHAGLSHRVAARRRELGLRMAIGASAPALRRAVVARGLALVGLGATVGVALALPTSALLDHQLYGVERNDPVTYALLVLALMVVGALAADAPARKAAAVDPVETLKRG